MGLLQTIVNAISLDVVAGLALLSMPALTDGAVLLGAARVNETSAPPRIVVEPRGFRFGPVDRAVISNSLFADDVKAFLLKRSLGTKIVRCRVYVWGIANATPGSAQVPNDDTDAALDLAFQFERSCLRVMPGIVMLDDGQFSSTESPEHSVLAITGWHISMSVEIPVPIVDYSLEFARDIPGTPIGYRVQTFLKPATGGADETGPVIDYIPS